MDLGLAAPPLTPANFNSGGCPILHMRCSEMNIAAAETCWGVPPRPALNYALILPLNGIRLRDPIARLYSDGVTPNDLRKTDVKWA